MKSLSIASRLGVVTAALVGVLALTQPVPALAAHGGGGHGGGGHGGGFHGGGFHGGGFHGGGFHGGGFYGGGFYRGYRGRHSGGWGPCYYPYAYPYCGW
jgi:hypothetical protein